jgi:uncharacterized protein (TIGR03085 family)
VSAWAQRERAVLVELFRTLGPDADVLCEGWTTADLAAHLYVRERRPDAAPGAVLPGPAASYTARVMASVLRVNGFDNVVDILAAGPPRLLRPLDEQMNLVEFFIHVEDVRRAQGDQPRSLPPEMERALFARLRVLLRMSLLRLRDVEVEVVTEHGERASYGHGPGVELRGPVGDVALWVFGRKAAAAVDLSGDPESILRLERLRLSV